MACVFAALFCISFNGQALAKPVLKFKETFGNAAHPTFVNPTALAVDQSDGDLLVVTAGDASAEPPVVPSISRFKSNGEPSDFSSLGTNVISNTPEGPLSVRGLGETQIAVDTSGSVTDGDIYLTDGGAKTIDIFARSGAYLGRLTGYAGGSFSEACGVSVDGAGNVYVGDYNENSARPSAVAKFAPSGNPVTDADYVDSFGGSSGPLEGTCSIATGAAATSGSFFSLKYGEGDLKKVNSTTGQVATIARTGQNGGNVTVDPESGNVIASGGLKVHEYEAAGSSATETTSFEAPTTIAGIASGPNGILYVSRSGASEIEVWGHVPKPTPTIGSATVTAPDAVTLSGTVNPENVALTDCKFEYGQTTIGAFENQVPCDPTAAQINPNGSDNPVTASISGLTANTTYKFRLSASNLNGTTLSGTRTFTTNGPPEIHDVEAFNATEESIMLQAKIDPRGAPTRYRIEWGPSSAYGSSLPANGLEPSIGSGVQPVLVTAELSDLAPASSYHYRVVAINNQGQEVTSPDQLLETVNSCGLPEGRCFELVSEPDVGPVDLKRFSGESELHYQAANRTGALAYVSEIGTPSSPRSEFLSRAIRGEAGWTSVSLNPETTAISEASASLSSRIFSLNEELNCGVLASNLPLSSNPAMRIANEEGGANLYLQTEDSALYQPITALAPENPASTGGALNTYSFYGMSDTCGKVVFKTPYTYSGVTHSEPLEGEHLYEWTGGVLRSVSSVPSESGEVVVEPLNFSKTETFPYDSNSVSADGSRVVFAAKREEGRNFPEVQAVGVFVRENGLKTKDVSLSETETPDVGAAFQYATADGRRIFFIANSGLVAGAASGSSNCYEFQGAPDCVLYEYDAAEEKLAVVSPELEGEEAGVAGLIGTSRDGSVVYFAASGRLTAGEGKTTVENERDGTYSIYKSESGKLTYIGEFDAMEINRVAVGRRQTSRVSPDGSYLLFESQSALTGYENPTGAHEVYLYDSLTSTSPVICVSCRQDGQPSVAPVGGGSEAYDLSSATITYSNSIYAPRSLAIVKGKPVVFFNSFDSLAPDTKAGVESLYEWSHGQVFRVVAEPPGLTPNPSPAKEQKLLPFLGASEDASDLYFQTPETLSAMDSDERSSVYDARIGAVKVEPATGVTPCNPVVERSCQGTPSESGTSSKPASEKVSGEGNLKPKKHHKKKHHKKKHHKKKHHKKKHHKKKQGKRHAQHKRGASK